MLWAMPGKKGGKAGLRQKTDKKQEFPIFSPKCLAVAKLQELNYKPMFAISVQDSR